MNREEKAVVIDEIAANITDAQAIFAVDFRGITVPQAADLRDRLRAADASFRVVKNSLTERAADQAGVAQLKELLAGPTALTFVRGDAATAAKAIADYARLTQKLAFKGGVMDGITLAPEQVTAISRLPSRDVLYGQLVGLVASPLTGLARTLNALIGGLAVALGGVLEKKESGEVPAGDPPAAEAPAPVEAVPTEVAEEPVPVAEAAPAETPAAQEEAPATTEEPAEAPAPPAPGVDAPTTEAPAEPAHDVSDPGITLAAPSDAPPAPETPAAGYPPTPVADPPVAEPPHPAGAAATDGPPTETPTPDAGDEVVGAPAAQTDEAQAEPVPAAEAPTTEEPPHKENT